MKKLFTFLILSCGYLAINAQSDSTSIKVDSCECGKEEMILDFCEEMPAPFMGWTAWDAYVKSNIRYPELYKEQSIEGTVYVGLTVDLNGNVCTVVLKKGIPGAPLLDAEALRVVKESSPWIPGKMNGRAVCTRINIPIRFRLN